MNHSKPLGTWSGLGCIAVGLIFALINFFAILFSDSYFPKLFILAGTFVIMGIAMMLVPGSVIPADTPDNQKLKVWWSSSPVMHRIIWVLAGITGLGLSFYMMLQIDPGFI